jgi:hypothetical protein
MVMCGEHPRAHHMTTGQLRLGFPPQNLEGSILARGGRMHLVTKRNPDSGAVSLHGAVLCIDCECITHGLSDECLVCGSRSLFSLARMLGATQPASAANRSKNTSNIVLLDAEIVVNLGQIEPRELSAAVEGITNLIAPTLVRGRACFHIKVEPVLGNHNADRLRVA